MKNAKKKPRFREDRLPCPWCKKLGTDNVVRALKHLDGWNPRKWTITYFCPQHGTITHIKRDFRELAGAKRSRSRSLLNGLLALVGVNADG